MKKLLYSVIVLLMLPMLASAVAKSNVEKKKTIHKTYTVKNFVKLSIDNSFGRVHINTTSGNEIDVKVEVVAKQRSEQRALEMLDKININIAESGSVISFETDMDGKMNNRGGEGFEVNYMVSMPKSNPLYLKNSFGDTYLSDLDGDVELKIAYGDVKTEGLNGTTKLKLSFSDGYFKSVKSGELEVKYSDATFGELGVVKMEQGFSDVSVDRVKTIDLTSKYGDMQIGSVEGIRGYVGFSDLTIDYLIIEADMEASYAGDFSLDKVSKDFKSLELRGKFSSFDVNFEEGSNGTFEAGVKYGDFDYSDDQMRLTYKNKSDNHAEYKGVIGNGKGGKLVIQTSYGNIDIE